MQDVTAEHHTSDDGMGFTGGTGAACLGRQGWLGLFEIPEWSLNQSLNGHRAAFDGRKDRDVGSVGISRVT